MEHPTVITIARELGSGGSYIAQQVARRLGYAYMDREILQHAAKELGVEEVELKGRDERLQSFWDRLISVLALGCADGIYTPPPRWVSDEQLVETEQRLIRELTVRGPCVVLGRGAFYLLRGRPKVLNVFIHAPMNFRMQRVMSIYGAKDKREAADMIDRSDRERNQFVRFFAGLDRLNTRNYHLSIDTGMVDFTTAEDMIASMAAHIPKKGEWPWVSEPV
jgi:cytidylate kinase